MAESFDLQTCPKCKKRIMLAAKACVHCGWSSVQTAPDPNPVTTLAIPIPTPSQPDPEIIDADYSVGPPDYCPNCGYEGVRKVSAIYGEQSNSHDSTGLAYSLRPPNYPHAPNARAGPAIVGCNSIGYGCLSALGILVLGAMVFSGDHSGSTGAVMLCLSIGGGWLIGTYYRNTGMEKAEGELSVKLAQRDLDMKVYVRKAAFWDRLYYCPKCDQAIDPNTDRTAPPYAWQSLI